MPSEQMREQGLAVSRDDLGGAFQTSWADGEKWYKPSFGPFELRSYSEGTDMDPFRRAGCLYPSRGTFGVTDDVTSFVGCIHQTGTSVRAVGFTSPNYALLQWVATSPAPGTAPSWTTKEADLGENAIVSAAVDPSTGYSYFLTAANGIVSYDETTVNKTFSAANGTHILFHLGEMYVWNQATGILSVVNTTTGVATERFDTGMKPPIAESSLPSSRLAWSAPDGLYLITHSRQQGGQIASHLFRVDRDAAGNWMGYELIEPIVGFLAWAGASFQGSVVLSGTNEPWNLSGSPKTVLYHVTGDSVGAIGIPNGVDGATDQPVSLLGGVEGMLWMASKASIWQYDGVTGAVARVHSLSAVGDQWSDGTIALASWNDEAVGGALTKYQGILVGTSTTGGHFVILRDTGSTTPTDGVLVSTHSIVSNPIHFGLPHESKVLSRASILSEPVTTGESWTLEVSADGGAYTTAATITSGSYAATDSLDISGREFTYRLSYGTPTTVIAPLRSVMLSAISGDIIDALTVVLDGTQSVNVNNEPIDPEVVYDQARALQSNSDLVTVVDNYQSYDQDDTVGESWRIGGVTIVKKDAGEAYVKVELVSP
jgi:hypothetical protein